MIANSHCPVTDFAIKFRRSEKREWFEYSEENPIIQNNGSLKYSSVIKFDEDSFQRDRKYDFQLLAKNEFGWSEPSKIYEQNIAYSH